MIRVFPKAWAVGHRNVQKLWDGPVEITEKVDGSQFAFGKIDGQLICRSKGAQLYLDNPEKMFIEAVEYVQSIAHYPIFNNNYSFYAEYLKQTKHNTLQYNDIPKNHLALFGVIKPDGTAITDYNDLVLIAEYLGISVVPCLKIAEIQSIDQVLELLQTESFLGGPKIEGMVIKNYNHPNMIVDQWYPFIQAKYVSDAFKEKHNKDWKKHQGAGKLETMKQQYRSEARWTKAVNALRDTGELEHDPRDIGKLLKYLYNDLEIEEEYAIKEELWQLFRKDFLRASTAGFPEWYKELLLKSSFDGETE